MYDDFGLAKTINPNYAIDIYGEFRKQFSPPSIQESQEKVRISEDILGVLCVLAVKFPNAESRVNK